MDNSSDQRLKKLEAETDLFMLEVAEYASVGLLIDYYEKSVQNYSTMNQIEEIQTVIENLKTRILVPDWEVFNLKRGAVNPLLGYWHRYVQRLTKISEVLAKKQYYIENPVKTPNFTDGH